MLSIFITTISNKRKVVLLLPALQAYTHNKNIIMLFTKEHTHVPIHTDFFAILIWSLNSNTSFFPYWEHSFTWTTLFYGHTRYTSTLSVSKKTFLSIFNIFLQRGRKATGSPYHTTTLYTPTSTTVLSPLAPWDSLACTLYMTLPPPGRVLFAPHTRQSWRGHACGLVRFFYFTYPWFIPSTLKFDNLTSMLASLVSLCMPATPSQLWMALPTLAFHPSHRRMEQWGMIHLFRMQSINPSRFQHSSFPKTLLANIISCL